MSQRLVAFCFASGCSGAVKVDAVQSCVWETVIVSADQSDATDAFNFRQACEQLNSDGRNTANNAALILFSKIYKKLMTKALPYETPAAPKI